MMCSFTFSVLRIQTKEIQILKRAPSHNSLGWKGPVEIIQSNPSAKKGSAQAGDTGTCPVGLEYFQRGEIQDLPGQVVQCSATIMENSSSC